mmetsp:Transcript_30270/g.48177  ORF Transcript_30270/g.48177 Transcript_30270/m.48177 type:complete len:92 (+) Transcript_30270:1222-1497(+)
MQGTRKPQRKRLAGIKGVGVCQIHGDSFAPDVALILFTHGVSTYWCLLFSKLHLLFCALFPEMQWIHGLKVLMFAFFKAAPSAIVSSPIPR